MKQILSILLICVFLFSVGTTTSYAKTDINYIIPIVDTDNDGVDDDMNTNDPNTNTDNDINNNNDTNTDNNITNNNNDNDNDMLDNDNNDTNNIWSLIIAGVVGLVAGGLLTFLMVKPNKS